VQVIDNQLLCPECRTYCKNTEKLVKNYSINRQIENRRQSLEKFTPQTEQDHILQKQVQTLKSQLMLQQLQIQNLQQVNVKELSFYVTFLVAIIIIVLLNIFRNLPISILQTKPIHCKLNLKSKNQAAHLYLLDKIEMRTS